MTTRREQVMEFIGRSPGRDDDEITEALRFPQRQAVNIICRELADNGLIERVIGPRGKIVNNPISQRPSSDEAPQAQIELEVRPGRPPLEVRTLQAAAFSLIGDWRIGTDAKLMLAGEAPTVKGVYAFTTGGIAKYVGVASVSLKKRLYYYGRPGSDQKTNIRINTKILDTLQSDEKVSVYSATPPNLDWNGFTISGCAGLEVGLIESFHLPWNIRGMISS
jgi:hypothetical protein